MDKQSAQRATKAGAIAACASAAITLGVTLFAIQTSSSTDTVLGYFNDPWLMLDVIIILFLAWFIYKNSRVAAMIMVTYFVVSKVFLSFEAGRITGVNFITFVFLILYLNAVRGAFVFHRIDKEENPNRAKPKRWLIGIGALLCLAFLGLTIIGFMTVTGDLAPTDVQSGERLKEKYVNQLVDANVVSGRDDIQYFYSEAVVDIIDGGTVLTNESIISYYTPEDGETEIYELGLDEVTKLEVYQEGGLLADSIYKIFGGASEDWILIYLSVERDGHLPVLEILEMNIEANTGLNQKGIK